MLVWVLFLGVFCQRAGDWFSGENGAAWQQVGSFLSQPRSSYELRFRVSHEVRVGDPIFIQNEQGNLVQVGAIRQIESQDSRNYELTKTNWAEATFFSTAPKIQANDFLTYHETPESMDWVIRMMLPPEKWAKIAELFTALYQDNYQALAQDFQPVVETAIQQMSVVIREEFDAAIKKRQAEFGKIGQRLRVEVFDREIIPLVNEEIWPIVQRHVKPLLESVGEEIWARSSLWRFGWRAIYDMTPLPQQDLTKKEFSRFVQKDAVPVLQKRLPEFLKTQQQILSEIMANARVQEVIRNSFQKVANDRELQALMLEVLEEVFVNNPRINETFQEIWKSDATQSALAKADSRLEPTIVEIGESLFGSPHGGVTPEFARILRHKILLKDWRWFVLQQDGGGRDLGNGVLEVVTGETNTENPFFFPARER